MYTPIVSITVVVRVKAARIVVPHYDDIQLDRDGLVILPFDFLPGLVEQLPNDRFYVTYLWYKFFDKKQRDSSGAVSAPKQLSSANQDNATNEKRGIACETRWW